MKEEKEGRRKLKKGGKVKIGGGGRGRGRKGGHRMFTVTDKVIFLEAGKDG